MARYVIGIDLGTSNSALCYVDTLSEVPEPRLMPIPQLESPAVVKEAQVLPSFLYYPLEHETTSGTLQLDFQRQEDEPLLVVGSYALSQSAHLPGRVVASAKSWLVHPGVDREAGILPWGSEDIAAADKLSPVAVSARYLRHFRDVWNATLGAFHEDYRFEKQDIAITVPASFDEAAQRLTLLAAREAGYPDNLRLLEEPQAAFYHWLSQHQTNGNITAELLGARASITVLVCDIGGGTTDFSLFTVTRQTSGGPLIERIAVSDHILLGGDNIDLAIAHRLEQQLAGTSKLSHRQFRHLVFSARGLKERLLNKEEEDASQEYHVSVPAEGSSLFAGTLSASISRKAVEELVLDGFFPFSEADARPEKPVSALREWGLPYAADSRVSRHLAAFLGGRRVQAMLFNGGTLKPHFLQQRLKEIIERWQGGEAAAQLSIDDVELAVAKGAAYFGSLLQKNAAKIASGYARALYLELYHDEEEEESGRAELVCLLPQGFSGAEKITLAHKFHLLVGEPVRFQLYSSTHRPQDKAGDIIAFTPDEFLALPPVQTALALEPGAAMPEDGLLEIELEASLNELGLLQLTCLRHEAQAADTRWQLEFNLRKSAAQEDAGSLRDSTGALLETGVAEEKLRAAAAQISLFYGKKQNIDAKLSPKKLPRQLEEILRVPRAEWNVALLRSLWPALARGITRRARSVAHETTWLSLAGFVLRPGYGVQLDEWRISQLWRCFELGLSFPKEGSSQVQWWIMWRRVAGGLQRERQEALLKKIKPKLSQKNKDDPELWRLTGALERLPLEEKLALGELLTAKITQGRAGGSEPYIWALGRIGARVPLYASLHHTVPPEQVALWFEKLSALDWTKGDYTLLCSAFSQMCRLTEDRHRNAAPEVLNAVLQKMQQSGATAAQLRVLREYVEVELADQVQLFGEALPSGLRLVREGLEAGGPGVHHFKPQACLPL